ncbi:TrbI/VirB10 family protein [Sphingomonas pokkalii]|uniref:Conjugal transfer protein TrbI n=1 Tax=Sphingomonas pokkalii TaxID=2175090 RepID=A0A2U0SDP5_9SPHN|nr:TrbI/VirB10 family protein [Sphingomonas pokkalii]PVX29469.1 conjugal transfer protein TrbI [Sphingomonas pokkalii]
MSDDAVSPTPKLDPESLAIRVKPPRAIRFRRGVIIAIAALGSVALVAVAWSALGSRLRQAAAERKELSEPSRQPPPDTLNRLPASYGEVPKLGPPLPGDLGRPILERQRRMAAEVEANDPDGPGRAGAQAATQERDRELAELKAARASGLLVQNQSGPSAPVSVEVTAPPAPVTGEATLAIDPERDPNAQSRKAQFLATRDTSADTNPHRLEAAPSPYLLSAGSVIPASLMSGLRSDLPGLVTAQVTANVFDSPTGRILLIPQGARLVGSYDSVVAFGQKRALVIWQRILLPDGSSLRIDNVPATDASGYAGLQDKVDFHNWTLLKGIALSTLLGVGSELTVSGDSDLVRAIRQSMQQNVARAGDQLTSRNLNIQPTLTIRPGTNVLLVVHKDLILAPWRG